MTKSTIKRSISNKSNVISRSNSTDETLTSHTKLEQNSSLKKVQLEIKLNISRILEDYKPTYPYSHTITFRLKPVAPISPIRSITPISPIRSITPISPISPISPITPSNPKQILIKQNSTSGTYQNPQLEEKLNQFQPVLHVDLSYFHLIDPDIPIIVNKVVLEKKCTELWLFGNQITSQGASILAPSLVNNSILKSLDLSFNQISNLGVQSLTQALLPNKNCSIKILQLSKNGISDDGAKYLSEMLKTNQTLTELWLSDNEIGNSGVKQLMNTLSYHNKTLKFLSLSTNIFVTDLCIDSVIEMSEHNQTLKRFWMTGCNLTEQGQHKLREKCHPKKKFQIEL
jgi:hypothetical protein